MSDRGPIIGVGVIAHDADHRILVGWRVKVGETPSWCLPGGRVEYQESFVGAAVRELKEETGIAKALDARVTGFVHDDHHGHPRVTACVSVYTPAAVPVVTEPHNFQRWNWYALDAVPSPRFGATQLALDLFQGPPTAHGPIYPVKDV
jgi:8-oxo-dGTP pyrophosphatase MutT (NUDIX family)